MENLLFTTGKIVFQNSNHHLYQSESLHEYAQHLIVNIVSKVSLQNIFNILN